MLLKLADGPSFAEGLESGITGQRFLDDADVFYRNQVGPDIDPLFANVAVLYRFDEAVLSTTLPPNDGFATAPLTHIVDPPDYYHTTSFRKHYNTSLAGDVDNRGMRMDGTNTPTEWGVDDSFGSICYEAWILLDTIQASNNYIISSDSLEFYHNFNNELQLELPGRLDLTTSGLSLSAGTWYHVAAQRTGTRDWEIFVDGVSVATGSQSSASSDFSNFLLGGLDGFFNGSNLWFDSFRITTGVVRYPAATPFFPLPFYPTPPVAPPDPLDRRIPIFIGEGADNGSNFATTAPLPAGVVEGDFLLLQIKTDGNVGTPNPPNGSWTLIGDVDSGTTGAPQIANTLYYKFAGPSEANPLVADQNLGTQHVLCSAFRGVDPISPIGAVQTSSNSVASSSIVATGLTTLFDYSLVVTTFAGWENSFVSAAANADLLNFVLNSQDTNTSGNDSTIATLSGIKVTAGLVGDTTATYGISGQQANIMFELKGDPN